MAEKLNAFKSVFHRFNSGKAVNEDWIGHRAESSNLSIFDHGELNAVVVGLTNPLSQACSVLKTLPLFNFNITCQVGLDQEM
jgi:hypothetical protein